MLERDEVLFAKIYHTCNREVFKLIIGMLKDRHAAEELTQETFLALYVYGHEQYKDTQQVKFWLIKTAAHKALDYIKRYRRIIPVTYQFFEKLVVEDDCYRKIEEEEMTTALNEAIESLPAELKTIVILYYFNHMPHSAMAKTLKIPRGTVKSRLYKARRLLKMHLDAVFAASTAEHEKEN